MEDELLLETMGREVVLVEATINPIFVQHQRNAGVIPDFSHSHDKEDMPEGYYRETELPSLGSLSGHY